MAESSVIRYAIEVARLHDLLQTTNDGDLRTEAISKLEVALDDLAGAVEGYLRGL